MSKALRSNLWLAGLALLGIAGVLALRFAPSVMRLGRAGVVIRRPTPVSVAMPGDRNLRNIAPLATVTVSSEDTAPGQTGEGVADGQPDANEWITAREGAGAWITLSWDKPATVTEIRLYDRPDPVDNVVTGTLTFDDGSVIPVRALPAGGTPERVTFPPKTIRSVTFRIDQAQGRNAGLGEIMVMGTLN
ncbi:MAG: hypothetical protein NTW28_20470 [Candidatus Solibacter sp.]|nr:hypothetical protein [Candidatus Solibacter sp.]